jgi:hypothetical protein
MPDGVIGIDVDAYTRRASPSTARDTLAAAVAAWGPLPATWSSDGARRRPVADPFYRVPAGGTRPSWPAATSRSSSATTATPSSGRHRTRTPATSTAGTTRPARRRAAAEADELPELPQAWVDGLREGATDAGPAAAGREPARRCSPRCSPTTARPAPRSPAVLTAVDELSRPTPAPPRHRDRPLHQLVQLGRRRPPRPGPRAARPRRAVGRAHRRRGPRRGVRADAAHLRPQGRHRGRARARSATTRAW